MFFLSLFIDTDVKTVLNNLRAIHTQNSIIFLMLIVLANAFWQEVIFRGYFQKRLIDTYGVLSGIVICAFLFTVTHGLIQELNIVEIILGTVLFTLIGFIYYITDSIVFVTVIHATGNFFLRSFETSKLYIPKQEYRLLIYSIVLITFLIVYKNRIFMTKNSLIEQ